MKKLSALMLSVIAMAGVTAKAQDFIKLTTPEDVYAHSIEDVSGAKATFKAVLDSSDATDADKTAAMQTYQQNASPAPGYAFDMTYLMSYTAVTADNKGQYSKAQLAATYNCDVEGVTISADNNTLQVDSDTANGTFMRIYSAAAFKSENSFDKFLVYQNVELGKGSYYMTVDAFAKGAANCATLSAGNDNSTTAIAGSPMQEISLNFAVADKQEVKLGIKRNNKAGNLTHICFNNFELYKVSSIIAIKDDATAGLTEAENVDVQLCRTFEAGVYVPICLPFVIENWRDVFDNLLLWNNYADGTLEFKTVSGANTQARKPYLAKTKTTISAENYLMFYGVDIMKGNAGSWIKTVAEGEDPYPVKMQGNWAAGTVPANCYYLENGVWKLSDGTAPLTAFSAYIDATGLAEHPATLKMDDGSGTASIIDSVFSSETPEFVNVYNLQGIMIKQNVATESALEDLPAGIYIVNGKKFLKK